MKSTWTGCKMEGRRPSGQKNETHILHKPHCSASRSHLEITALSVCGWGKAHKEQWETEMQFSEFYACVEKKQFWSRLMLPHSPSSVPYKLQPQPYPMTRKLDPSLLFSVHKKSFTCDILQFNVHILFLNKKKILKGSYF